MKVQTGLVAGKRLGDAVADFTHATRLDKLAECYTTATGQDCGCAARQEALNRLAPDVMPGYRRSDDLSE
jgi:hypothetical protein